MSKGRQPKHSAEVRKRLMQRIKEAIAEGNTRGEALRAFGVPRGTWDKWMMMERTANSSQTGAHGT